MHRMPRRLQHRDELRWGGARAWLSTERLAAVEPMKDESGPRCPRCSKAVEAGAASVRCPTCGAAYHQDERKPCFGYAPQCAICSGETDLEGGYRFSPPEAL